MVDRNVQAKQKVMGEKEKREILEIRKVQALESVAESLYLLTLPQREEFVRQQAEASDEGEEVEPESEPEAELNA